MASSAYPAPPSSSFHRPASDGTSFDSRQASFFANHQQNGYRSFGEVNGQAAHSSDHRPQIYTAVYSSVSVYEMEVHGIAVMRRRNDSWLNATQILKVAGVEKGKRTKILEKEILTGQHEKIQGGYGKYQGTWISYHRGREFCRQYLVEDVLRPLLDYDMGADGEGSSGNVDTPTKEQAMAANRKRFYNSGFDNRITSQPTNNTFFQNISPVASHALAAMSKAARFESPLNRPGSAQKRPGNTPRKSSQQNINSQDSAYSQQSMQSFVTEQGAESLGRQDNGPENFNGSMYAGLPNGHSQEPPRKRMRHSFSQDMYGQLDPALQDDTVTEPNESFVYDQLRESDQGPLALPPLLPPSDKSDEEKRLSLLDLFADATRMDYSSHVAIVHLSGQELDLPLDASANTALHWAATLARVSLMKLLIQKGANTFRGNAAGQTPLMAAVQVNNSLDHSCFPEMLEILAPLIEVRDATGRTVLHHIAVSSGIKGRGQSSRYYLESLLEFIVRKGSSSNPDSQQESLNNGDVKNKPISLARFMSDVVNVQDKSGNTALNLVARIGNRPIINQLDEIGADFTIPNFTGFRPTDFGAFPRAQAAIQQPASQGVMSSQSKAPSQIDQIKEEIFATTVSILTQTQAQYAAELQKKQDVVNRQNAELRDLATVHKDMTARLDALQSRRKERAARAQRIHNMRLAIQERSAMRPPALALAHSAGAPPHPAGAAVDPALLAPPDAPPDAAPALTPALTALLDALPPPPALRAQAAAFAAHNDALAARVRALQSRSAELEAQYRKVVSLCTGADEAQVETMLEALVAAVESEEGPAGAGSGPGIDGRVREFLRKLDGVVV